MKSVQTVFMVNGNTYSYDGTGQEAANAVLQAFPNDVVLLHGFVIDGVFQPYNK